MGTILKPDLQYYMIYSCKPNFRPKKNMFVCPFPTDRKITKILGRVFIFIFFISIYNFKKFWIFAKKISLKKNLYFSHIFLSILKPKRICFYQQKNVLKILLCDKCAEAGKKALTARPRPTQATADV